jgi:hypothetical protein
MVNTETGKRRYHRLMSEQPPAGPPAPSGTGGFPTSRGQFPGAIAAPQAWPSTPPRGQSRALTFVALAVALIATGLAVVGWFRPSPVTPPQRSADPSYTEQQVSDAKTQTCKAFELVDKGVVLQTGGGGQPRPEPSSDPAMVEARAADARLSLVAGSSYLRDHLDPATAQPLSSAIRDYAKILANLAQNYLAGIKDADPAQQSLLNDSDVAFGQIRELCK